MKKTLKRAFIISSLMVAAVVSNSKPVQAGSMQSWACGVVANGSATNYPYPDFQTAWMSAYLQCMNIPITLFLY